jgi:hypothetical protein
MMLPSAMAIGPSGNARPVAISFNGFISQAPAFECYLFT